MTLPVGFVGDAHLLPGDETTDAFVRFLAAAPSRFSRLVLVGDLFDLWLARDHLHEEHHVRVLAALRACRAQGLVVDYAVGNRDFGVESLPAAPFNRVATVLLEAPHGASVPPPWLAEHGDLVNESDTQYRAWRAFARSPPVLGTFLRLPAALGVPLSQRLERRMRTTNLAYKRRFPEEHVLRRASGHFARTGARFLVLGHFHEERRLDVEDGSVLVLPDWKRARRHVEWRDDGGAGRMSFEPSSA